jgi:hypothetical protein
MLTSIVSSSQNSPSKQRSGYQVKFELMRRDDLTNTPLHPFKKVLDEIREEFYSIFNPGQASRFQNILFAQVIWSGYASLVLETKPGETHYLEKASKLKRLIQAYNDLFIDQTGQEVRFYPTHSAYRIRMEDTYEPNEQAYIERETNIAFRQNLSRIKTPQDILNTRPTDEIRDFWNKVGSLIGYRTPASSATNGLPNEGPSAHS